MNSNTFGCCIFVLSGKYVIFMAVARYRIFIALLIQSKPNHTRKHRIEIHCAVAEIGIFQTNRRERERKKTQALTASTYSTVTDSKVNGQQQKRSAFYNAMAMVIILDQMAFTVYACMHKATVLSSIKFHLSAMIIHRFHVQTV